ncbi:MAG: hypothetical protein ICV74_09985 [Thermoleophilia bacterium]|nr:hypothetical protein [Thermoleophilia bacterium]
MRNAPAVLALLVALLALALLGAAAWAARTLVDVSWLEAALAAPAAGLLSLLALSLAGRAERRRQRTLGRAGGIALAQAGRLLGWLALLITISAALALAVFGILVWTDGLTRTPW